MGSQKFGCDPDTTLKIAKTIKQVVDLGSQVSIVVGGGNIFRGIKGVTQGLERTPSDHIGMLATMINGLALQQALHAIACESIVMSAIPCDLIAETYNWKKALQNLDQGRVVIFVGGSGNPYFTTDTAAALRALEMKAEIVMKATKVSGVYDKDPLKYTDAVMFDQISYSDVLMKKLEVMDATAIALCRENSLPIRVFNIFEEDALVKAVTGQSVGTLVE
jgi:uridylate kinase